jgi:hypothetical protein
MERTQSKVGLRVFACAVTHAFCVGQPWLLSARLYSHLLASPPLCLEAMAVLGSFISVQAQVRC